MEVAMNNLDEFLEFLNDSTSPFHVVKNCSDILDREGFECLSFEKPWDLKKGGSYYLQLYDTTLFAFKIGQDINENMIIRIAAAHTDFPSFRIKPNPDMQEKGYMRLNTEAYGGMILSSWYDRALSAAGKVALKSDRLFAANEVLVDFLNPIMVIPNLAIHLNKDINKGVEINKQTDILPLLGTSNEDSNNFKALLGKQLRVSEDDIIDYDLFIYNVEKAKTAGINNEFICSPRLDDLSSVYALLQGITAKVNDQDIHMICLFDNEEVGNKTKQGCASQFTSVFLEKLFASLGKNRINLYEVLLRSTIISADVAQAYHPNFPSKFDPTNRAELNKGIVIKIDTTQKYAFDTGAVAIIQQLCDKYDIRYQKFANRSDVTAGSTMGPVISSLLPVRTIDIGIPLLAMHSAMETMGVKDQESMMQFMKAYFSADR
jgi:aspartyl aminopeptidase